MSDRSHSAATERAMRAVLRARMAAQLEAQKLTQQQNSQPRSLPVRGGVKLEVPRVESTESFEEVKPMIDYESKYSKNKMLRSDSNAISTIFVTADDQPKNGVMVLSQGGLDLAHLPSSPRSSSIMKSYHPPTIRSERRNVCLYFAGGVILVLLGILVLAAYEAVGEREAVLIAEAEQIKPWVDHQCRDPAMFMMAPPEVQEICNVKAAKIDGCCRIRALNEVRLIYTSRVMEATSSVMFWIFTGLLIIVVVTISLFACCAKVLTDGWFKELLRFMNKRDIRDASISDSSA